MRRQKLTIGIFGTMILLILSGCKPDLLPIGRPDLSGPISFCKTDDNHRLMVTVKNQGNADAAASTTTVEFNPGGSVSIATPAIPAGGTVDLSFTIPSGCFNPDCDFTITVDSKNDINESNEGNNSAKGICIG